MIYKNEATLVKAFEKHVLTKYGRDTFFYVLYETSYGQCGFPDIIIKVKGIEASFYVEAKNYSISRCIRWLRPTQIGTITQLAKSDAIVCILSTSGVVLANYEKMLKYIEIDDDSMPFSGFDELVKSILGGYDGS